MVTRIEFGRPFETFAVVEDTEKKGEEALKYFTLSREKTDGVDSLVFTYELKPEDIVYGLGETLRGINKRGGRYVMFNTDDSHHREDMPSLYGSHNFLVVDGQEHFGFFFDTPSRVVFDVDLDGSGLLKVYCETTDLKLYQLEGDSSYGITREFLHLIGQSFIPPLWAFGYIQSRWGYKSSDDCSRVIEKYRKLGIPLDGISMDIDYMDRFIDFTVHKSRFPKYKEWVERLKKKGVHVVPIIDAGIKIEPGNEVFDDGIRKDVFCKNAAGKNFGAAVWPGLTHFTDFCRPEARNWFGDQFRYMTDKGVEGFWIDMNEPAIFWTEGYTREHPMEPEPEDETHLTMNSAKSGSYKSFYHDYDGRHVRNFDVHNVFGHFMAMGSAHGLEEQLSNRYLLFSRSSYVGTHRYAGIWTGDNHSSWLQMKRNLTEMPGLNMVGLLYSGADTGGFSGFPDREMMLRWHALSAFTPLFRNHSSMGSSRRELYLYTGLDQFRSILNFRYKLIPYLYSEFVKSALRRDMLMKPLGFVWPEDEEARRSEDQLLVGESVMMAPVLEPGVSGRSVYLPEDMTEVRWDGKSFTEKKVSAGRHEVAVPVDNVVFWIRKARLVPVSADTVLTTKDLDLSRVVLLGDGTEYEQYRDDGFTKDVSEKNLVVLKK